eukprot:CAMPEP_0119129456 /NCGR_PEP_ID=MMETSP1310-20130426/7194_1 /TAXON_ID=464262 /ORGANISM="Genus nov. species nov., Strain RCC2339" /LENGTH=603 /DNA_ID=CAMNT_0007119875 /DNA_START=306 /DNA_END=2114 /DNA_ORIENTATION=-
MDVHLRPNVVFLISKQKKLFYAFPRASAGQSGTMKQGSLGFVEMDSIDKAKLVAGNSDVYVATGGGVVRLKEEMDDHGPTIVPLEAPVPTIKRRVKALACGASFMHILNEAGEIFGWGSNEDGEVTGLPGPPIGEAINVTEELGLPMCRKLACGDAHTLALGDDCQVYAWGCNCHGECGRVSQRMSRKKGHEAVLFPGMGAFRSPVPIMEVSAVGHRSAAVSILGQVWVWGAKLGRHFTSDAPEPRVLVCSDCPKGDGRELPLFVCKVVLGEDCVAALRDIEATDSLRLIKTLVGPYTVDQVQKLKYDPETLLALRNVHPFLLQATQARLMADLNNAQGESGRDLATPCFETFCHAELERLWYLQADVGAVEVRQERMEQNHTYAHYIVRVANASREPLLVQVTIPKDRFKETPIFCFPEQITIPPGKASRLFLRVDVGKKLGTSDPSGMSRSRARMVVPMYISLLVNGKKRSSWSRKSTVWLLKDKRPKSSKGLPKNAVPSVTGAAGGDDLLVYCHFVSLDLSARSNVVGLSKGKSAGHGEGIEFVERIQSLASYIPQAVVRKFLSSDAPPENPKMDAFPAATLFIDISGFSSLNERLAKMG